MNNKLYFLFPLFFFNCMGIKKNEYQSHLLRKAFENDFKSYFQKYSLNIDLPNSDSGLVIKYGDINEDNIMDAIIQYSFLFKQYRPEIGNAFKGLNGIAVYSKGQNGKTYLLAQKNNFEFKIDTIIDNKIRAKKLIYLTDDPLCCPSKFKYVFFVLKNSTIVVDSIGNVSQ